jgi:hypothetical protein
MIIKVDDKELFTLTEIQKKVLKNDIKSEVFEEDIKRRLFYIINHKYEQCFKRLKAEWEPKLAKAGVESIPTDKDKFAELVFSQPDYKDRSARELDIKT